MTANQITKKLAKAGVETNNLTIEKDEVEVCVGYFERNGFGMCDDAKTKKLANQVKKALSGWSHISSTGYGAIRIMFNFTKSPLVSQNID